MLVDVTFLGTACYNHVPFVLYVCNYVPLVVYVGGVMFHFCFVVWVALFVGYLVATFLSVTLRAETSSVPFRGTVWKIGRRKSVEAALVLIVVTFRWWVLVSVFCAVVEIKTQNNICTYAFGVCFGRGRFRLSANWTSVSGMFGLERS